jgi:hypothetical protein
MGKKYNIQKWVGGKYTDPCSEDHIRIFLTPLKKET